MFRKAKATIPKNLLITDVKYTILTGIWEDSVGMFKCNILPSFKHKGYKVIENRKIRKKNKPRITFMYNDDDTTIILTAPWGENGTKKSWTGRIEDDGNKIVWSGWRGELIWLKIPEKNDDYEHIFDPSGRYSN